MVFDLVGNWLGDRNGVREVSREGIFQKVQSREAARSKVRWYSRIRLYPTKANLMKTLVNTR
jgi:hypothetical protein